MGNLAWHISYPIIDLCVVGVSWMPNLYALRSLSIPISHISGLLVMILRLAAWTETAAAAEEAGERALM